MIGLLLGTIAQGVVDPSKASILFTLEGPMASLFSYFILGNIMTESEIVGALVIFSMGVLVSSQSTDEDGDEENRPIRIESIQTVNL